MPVSKTPRKAAGVRRTAVKKAAPTQEFEYQPVALSASPASDDDSEKVLLFSITQDDGTVDEYFAPRVAPVAMSLKLQYVFQTQGQDAAGLFALERLVGKDGLAVLMDCEGLTNEALEQITNNALSILMGRVEAGKAR